MLFRQDLGLDDASGQLRQALVLLAASQSRMNDAFKHIEMAVNRLPATARALARWEEDDLADKTQVLMRRIEAELASLRSVVPAPTPGQVASTIAEWLKEASELSWKVAQRSPVEGDVDPKQLSGMMVGLFVARKEAYRTASEPTFWTALRQQLHILNAVRVTPYEARTPQGQRSTVFFGPARRQVVRPLPSGYRLLDERGQELSPECAGLRYAVFYFFVPHPAYVTSLLGMATLLGQHVSACAHVAQQQGKTAERDAMPFAFKVLTAPATLSRQPSRIYLIDDLDRTFDLFSQIILDPALENTIVAHPQLMGAYASNDRRRDWFGPVWRVPFQHRRDAQVALDWLCATPRFCGMPGAMSAMDLQRREAKGQDAPLLVRAPTRIAAPRPVRCKVTVDDTTAPLRDGYLLDYSPTGCRLELDQPLAGCNITSVCIPTGLPWPWRLKPWKELNLSVDRCVPASTPGGAGGSQRVSLHFDGLVFVEEPHA